MDENINNQRDDIPESETTEPETTEPETTEPETTEPETTEPEPEDDDGDEVAPEAGAIKTREERRAEARLKNKK